MREIEAEQPKVKISLGSGYNKQEGYISLDKDPNTSPDAIVDLESDRLPFQNDSVDEVRAYHVLEHIGLGFFHLIQEIYRVCKEGAFVDIVVPHHFHEVFINDPTHKRPITVEGMRLFSKKHNQVCIQNKDSSSCLGIAYGVDFEIMWFGFVYDPFYKDIIANNTYQQNERLLREAVNVAIETKIQLIVIKQQA